MTNMDVVFSISSFETLVLSAIVVSMFVYTFAVLRHKEYPGHHVDTMAGDEGDD
jgi:hypothetical protein